MKITQDSETGKLIIDGEGVVVKCTKTVPSVSVLKITNIYFDFSEVDKSPSVPSQALESPVEA